MARHHARAIAQLGDLGKVVAVAEPIQAIREGFLEACPGVRAFDSLSDLLANEAVDVIHVCTPPATHEELGRVALEAGCHTYVEKPFAQTEAVCRELLSLGARKGLRVCAGHQLLFEGPTVRALALLPSAGMIHHVESYFSFRPVRTGSGGREPLRADLQLLDVLPHPVYSLLHFLERVAPEGAAEVTHCALGPGGTLHLMIRRDHVTAALVVTLEGRPVESYLRIVGSNGIVHADFLRGTVQHLLGPGISFIDKALNPFRLAGQLTGGTTRSLVTRLASRRASYPGLAELIEAFYRCIQDGSTSPISGTNIAETVAVCERVSDILRAADASTATDLSAAPDIAITGGTGFLGAELARVLVAQGRTVRVLARRLPPYWARISGVEYVAANLADVIPPSALEGIETVIHLAAETAGGFEDHRKNSVEAAERLCRAAAAAQVLRMVHVSSLAVYSQSSGSAISEETPIEPEPRRRGPYVWGKVESEHTVSQLASELGLRLKMVRPGAIIDSNGFDPPGRLGRRVGNVFVAVGSRSERLGVIDRHRAANTLAWLCDNFDDSPDVVNLLEPELPTKHELVHTLRASNPSLRVIWLPNIIVKLVSRIALWLQALIRSGGERLDLAGAFKVEHCDTTLIAGLTERMESTSTEQR